MPIIKNVSARGYWIEGKLVPPGEIIDVTPERHALLMASPSGRAGELTDHDVPMPKPRDFGTKTLDSDKALDLISKLPPDKLESITEGDERPEVLSAVLRRKRGPGR